MKKICSVLITTLFLCSCSTMKGSLMTGIGTGAALGAGGGAVTGSKNKGKSAATGALIGAAVGGLTSYFFHKHQKKKEDRVRRETLFNLDKHNVSMPRGYTAQHGVGHGVTMPVVESEWVETQVKGKKLVEGHRIWIITEDAQWLPSKKK